MTDSKSKTVSIPVFAHSNQRTWLDMSGRVIAAEKKVVKPAEKRIEWEASVVDTATDTEVKEYPTLSGDVTVPGGEDADYAVEQAYINKCRFLDGSKPDIAQLEKNVMAGIWEIHVKTPEPA